MKYLFALIVLGVVAYLAFIILKRQTPNTFNPTGNADNNESESKETGYIWGKDFGKNWGWGSTSNASDSSLSTQFKNFTFGSNGWLA